jgi:cellulose biosynthesis protein BcsQ
MSSIVTLYSYKGGVGRSMALANVAFELAKKGMRILIVDWDLEAPGLERYFSKYRIEESKAGLLSLLIEVEQELKPLYQDYLCKILIDSKINISLLASGREQDSNYSANLEKFDWEVFLSKKYGGEFLE